MRRGALLVVAMITAALVAPAGAVQAAPGFGFLRPGGRPRLAEKVPVNVIFLGYEPDQVPAAGYTAGLPRGYEPVVRSRLPYGVTEKLGITYTYDYHVSYSSKTYENAFFRTLSELAVPAPLTAYQQAYNEQAGRTRDVTANHYLDAPSVEKWLAYHPPAGVDTRRDTIFFINWFGRADFKTHVYTKMDEPDPDTGRNFGAVRDYDKLIAWGGTTSDDEEDGLGSTRRVWFHDLSAGPEQFTRNWNITDEDVEGDGVADYRMPAIWEYAANGYRAPAALAGDLSKITRYVALNQLMTTSPLYPPELPAAGGLPASINLDSNTYEAWPGVDASDAYIKQGHVLEEVSDLRWRTEFDFDNQDLPYDGKARECFENLWWQSCYPESGYSPGANLYLYNWKNLERTQDDTGRVDYELPIFNYAVTDEQWGGFADEDWVTGDQTGVFAFVSPAGVEQGYGLTSTLIHEVGHHLGLSHPHDGYDSETGVQYAPGGDMYFVWAGDEVNSVMSYNDLNQDFSQFDRDNSDRFLTAAYHEAANRLAASVGTRSGAQLRAADGLLGRSTAAFAHHDYRSAYAYAEHAYLQVRAAAAKAGVDPDAVAKAAPTRGRDTPHEFLDNVAPQGPRGQR